MPRARERDSLVLGGVIGDIVDFISNSMDLSISYNNRPVINGVEFRPSAVINPPRVLVGGDSMRNFYTLVLVDPDAPTPTNPTAREYLHWMVTDIPETTTAEFGQDIVSYEAPQPSSGIHRLVFVLFRQQQRETVLSYGGRNVRENFCTRIFAHCYNLGNPAAAVYYNCQRERGSGGRRFC